MASSALSSSTWMCVRCLRRQQRGIARRTHATAAAQVRIATPSPVRHEVKHDDADLRAVFDNQAAWASFSAEKLAAKREATGRPYKGNVGLFGNRYLKSPEGFAVFARQSLQRCDRILSKVLSASTVQEYRVIVKDMDRLSDALCRLLDLADFIAVVHPNAHFTHAARKAHLQLLEYMERLNSTPELYLQLVKAMGIPEVSATWTEEEAIVAEVLKRDFEKSAIHLPATIRNRYVELSRRISEVGNQFYEESPMPAKGSIRLKSKQLKGLDRGTMRGFEGVLGSTNIPSSGWPVHYVLSSAHEEAARKQVYIESRTSAPGPLETLEEMLSLRHELATLCGFSSHAEVALSDKMARTSDSVVRFLDSFTAAKSPEMRHTLADIAHSKRRRPEPWDLDYYAARHRRSTETRLPGNISSYFSLGTVIQGFSRLCSRLYGVRLVPRETGEGETWHPDVRRLDVISETEGLIAVIYCDLFYRIGKSSNPAHFTIRCSRTISEDEVRETAEEESPLRSELEPALLANDGMAIRRNSAGELYQLPTIAIVCDFAPPSHNVKAPPLLSPQSFTTLFHELGHAVHSILGRTQLQNVSGTRVAHDFAELPSILMEYFATDPTVLSLAMRHYETDEPLPRQAALALQSYGKNPDSASDILRQIMMMRIDLALHGETVGGNRGWSNGVVQQVYRQYFPMQEPAGTNSQAFNGHLVGYASVYYSYLFDRVIAGRVWEQVFRSGRDEGGIDRAAGERFAGQVLRYGGSKNPWVMLGNLFGGADGDVLKDGGEKAMGVVGKWGLDLA